MTRRLERPLLNSDIGTVTKVWGICNCITCYSLRGGLRGATSGRGPHEVPRMGGVPMEAGWSKYILRGVRLLMRPAKAPRAPRRQGFRN